MDNDVKREAMRQYLRYFRVWFIITGLVLAVTVVLVAAKLAVNNRPRGNAQAPKERVYDEADVFTEAEERQLREYIAKCEKHSHADIIILTINEPVGLSDEEWEYNMMNRADDFYDDNKYGWNREYGDGALLLYNWYEDEQGSQKGAWLSTSGKMEKIIGAKEEKRVLDAFYDYIHSDPYQAYRAAIHELDNYGKNGYSSTSSSDMTSLFCVAWVFPLIVALIYAIVNMTQSKAKVTTNAHTYVENGKPVMRDRADDFIRKNVVKRHIDTSSSSGGGGGGSHHSGGGSHGHHTSSGGHSHGGGGRRG